MQKYFAFKSFNNFSLYYSTIHKSLKIIYSSKFRIPLPSIHDTFKILSQDTFDTSALTVLIFTRWVVFEENGLRVAYHIIRSLRGASPVG